MEIKEHNSERFKRAKKRVDELKRFFKHLKAYIIVNIFLLLIKGGVLGFITIDGEAVNINFLDWVDYNFLLTPILWGIGLLIHGLYVYRHKFRFLKDWEQRQIRKYLEEDRKL